MQALQTGRIKEARYFRASSFSRSSCFFPEEMVYRGIHQLPETTIMLKSLMVLG